MVPASAYGLPAADASGSAAAAAARASSGGGATFGVLAEAVLRAGALAIGYRRADGRMLLAPDPDECIDDWGQGEELVCILDAGDA